MKIRNQKEWRNGARYGLELGHLSTDTTYESVVNLLARTRPLDHLPPQNSTEIDQFQLTWALFSNTQSDCFLGPTPKRECADAFIDGVNSRPTLVRGRVFRNRFEDKQVQVGCAHCRSAFCGSRLFSLLFFRL